MRALLFVCLSLMMAVVPFARGAQDPGLREIVGQALDTSDVLRAARARAGQAEQSLTAARRQRYPVLGLEAAAIRSDDPVFAFGSLLRQDRFGTENFAIDRLNRPGFTDTISASLTLGMPLYAGGRLAAGSRAAHAQAAYARAMAGASRDTLLRDVSAEYLNILYYTALATHAAEAEAAAAKHVEAANRLRARGAVPGAEYYAALAMQKSLTARRIAAENGRRTAVTRLSVMAGSPGALKAVRGVLAEKGVTPPDRESLLAAAQSGRRDIAMAGLQSEAAAAAFAAEKSGRYPTVNAFGTAQGDTYGSARPMPVRYTVGMNVSVPLFDPVHAARVKNAEERCAESSSLAASLKDGAWRDVTEAYDAVETAGALLAAAQEARTQARQAAQLTRALYREGRATVLDAMRGEEGALQAQAAAAEAAHKLHLSYIMLLSAAGRYDETAVAAVSAAVEEGAQ